MGGSSFSFNAYEDLSRTYSTKSQSQIFASNMVSTMNPKDLTFRECRDTPGVHENSVPIIVGLDVTGSMGSIPENLIKNKLGKLMELLINNGVKDASICFLGIGDHISDDSPLQVGQFESGTDELDKCLTSIYIEHGGGGQRMESYQLAWLFASRHTSTDSFEKRGIKGFLFTIGDEYVHPTLQADFLRSYMGYKEATEISTEDLLEEAKRTYNVFHIHCNDGSYKSEVSDKWKNILNENLIIVDDSNNIAEIIASTVSIMNGADMADLLSQMDKNTAASVGNSLAKISHNEVINYSNTGVITL